MATIFGDPFMEQQFSNLQSKALPYQVDAHRPKAAWWNSTPDLSLSCTFILSVVSPPISLPFPSVTQLDQFALLENAMNTTVGGSCFDPPSSSSSLYYSQAALSGLGGSHGSLQDPVHMRSNMYSNCSGGLPNIILTGKSGFISFWTRNDLHRPQGAAFNI